MITIDNDGDQAARKIIGISFNLARRGMQNTTGYRLLLMKRHSYMFALTNGRVNGIVAKRIVQSAIEHNHVLYER